MLYDLEMRNQRLWEDHPTILEDATHVIGGVGLGLLLFPVVRRHATMLGWSMVMLSGALHIYADTYKPRRYRSPLLRVARQRLRQPLSL